LGILTDLVLDLCWCWLAGLVNGDGSGWWQALAADRLLISFALFAWLELAPEELDRK
jgi:hypothetical protein